MVCVTHPKGVLSRHSTNAQLIPEDGVGEGQAGLGGLRGLGTGGAHLSLPILRATHDPTGGYRINYQFILEMLL